MVDFLIGALAGIAATVLIAIIVKWAWPNFKDKCLYNGVRVAGTWEIVEVRNSKNVKAGTIELTQKGRIVKGTSTRTKTRDGKTSERKFHYHGFVNGHQATLIFEDAKGVGFDTGTYVFTVQNDANTMIGMATFHGKLENKIVSEPRTLIKAVS
ncbi:hypothetical protein [Pseudomonas fluorescens]|uniref:Uncharacterized protein n=1 Tax=Pseudomonas fluorescens TaxID=294 RepID=A0A944HGK7_PSEFL|nr:hypothetical protein [Pseudomonas fluorescens]MBT2311821.1 hypothetical protein [Pseudomonas fluorescens]MBT2316772.1 hypothetical protein [Pseudomonas fluorescens]MBT2329799.1 hypothetical protein [Pseudomonas fluorescens]MBT2344591.1 hypothetical protein [Pseudomonas fluorescens]MBT2348019.1 hypothetical protein [Pseudomonas fluorescens]